MMSAAELSEIVVRSIAAALALVAIVHLIGFRRIREAYSRWEYPRNYHRVVGTANLVAASFLAIPETRFWGVALAAPILFVTVIKLLSSRNYLYALPGMALLAALPTALITATV